MSELTDGVQIKYVCSVVLIHIFQCLHWEQSDLEVESNRTAALQVLH